MSIEIGELYQHYKGEYYRVQDFAKHSETGEKLIIYYNVILKTVYARPKAMWFEEVDEIGTKRFTKI